MLGIINLLLQFSQSIGYTGIILLMTIESSFIPFPSEIVIPPAAFLAQQGYMNIWLVIISGIAGSLLGAVINYYLAMFLGRKIIYRLSKTKFARALLINEDKIEKSEKYFKRYGNISTFIGRFIPAIRQLISIPAGFSKMKFSSFVFFTFIGSSIWVIILAILGYLFGANKDILSKYYHSISIFFITIGALFIVYLIYLSIKKKK